MGRFELDTVLVSIVLPRPRGGGVTTQRPLRVSIWFLAVSYGIGAPVTAVVELLNQALSQRFGLPAELIFGVCAVQLASAAAVLVPALTPWSAMALTATTFGAMGAHLSLGSPLTALPAAFYSALQIWVAFRSHRLRPARPGSDSRVAPPG